MRVFLLFILLFVPITVNAAINSSCDTIIGNTAESICKGTPGCYWSGTYGCSQCPIGNYCPGDGTNTPQPCPSDFQNTLDGAGDINDCFKENQTCTNNNGQPDNSCRQYYDGTYKCGNNHDINAHNESDTCYYNKMNCNQFTSSCDSVSETATWANGQWNVSDCKCTATNATISDKNCTGHAEYEATTQTIANMGGTIAFNQTPTSYYCTSCTDATYYPTAGTTTEYPTCGNPESGHYKACSCVKIEKGYYNKNNTTWQNNMPITNVIIEACPMGQTTTSAGSNTCIYDSDTKICDSNGCTSLSNPSAWSPSN